MLEQHYADNREKYQQISQQLDDMRHNFLSADLKEQRRLLLKAHEFAVISVQTPIQIHEKAWERLQKYGLDHDPDPLESVNYNNSKAAYIHHARRLPDITFSSLGRRLANGNIDQAHRYIADNFKGVGTVKSAFILAMLGFKDKACLDTNVINFSNLERDDVYDGVVIKKYNQFVRALFNDVAPDLDHLSNFLTQWVIFNYQRTQRGQPFVDHSVFFKEML